MALSYDEYQEYINETFDEFKNDEKMSGKEAIARTFNEYDMLMNKSETDKLVISVIISEIIVTLPKVLITFRDYILNILSTLNFESAQHEGRLTSEQYNSLVSRHKTVIDLLRTIPLDYYPRVCWYYEELTVEVSTFIKQLIQENIDYHQIIPLVFKRFEKDLKNTLSEKIIIFTTIIENLVNLNYFSNDEMIVIKHELQDFNIAKIGDEQLSDWEIHDLDSRVKNALVSIESIE
ncbi:Imm3 family immunity protein [Paenibacillus sp. NPDC058174]|uniref:Imm3 family immunity protein n=1 Tax=Paenibacillus sp. NPDC058174 TaxID=3346366 RepID=UPI0036DB8C7A